MSATSIDAPDPTARARAADDNARPPARKAAGRNVGLGRGRCYERSHPELPMSHAADAPHDTISIVVPAHDEEANLASVLGDAATAAARSFADYEIVVVDDGSRDGTAAVAAAAAAGDTRIRVITHTEPHGLGGAFKAGLREAKHEWVSVVHGNGGTDADALASIWRARDGGDFVVPFLANEHERPRVRRIVSRAFAGLVNLLFHTGLRYHLHYVLARRCDLADIEIRTDSNAFQAEVIVKLLRRGCRPVEVGVCDRFEEQSPSRSLRPGHGAQIGRFFLSLLYDVYVGGDGRAPRSTSRDE